MKKQNNIYKIKKFKYILECGFFITLNGQKKFIVDNVDSPYTNSLLKLIQKKPIGNKNYINRHQKIIMIDSTGHTPYYHKDDLISYYMVCGNSVENVEKLRRNINIRENVQFRENKVV